MGSNENTALARRDQQTALTSSTPQEAAVATVDRIAGSAMTLLQGGPSFGTELALARAMNEMRAALTPELVTPLMDLMNSDLGFRTDRDKSSGKPAYSAEVVRDVFIEAKLRGFRALGNEFNIISGRFYGAKNGFRRKVQTWPGLADLKETYDAPKISAGGNGAIVNCRATWIIDGVPQSIEAAIPIKTSDPTAVDMILGKAERRLLKRIHDRLGGVVTPEGDANEEVMERTTFVQAPPMPNPPRPAPASATAAAAPVVDAFAALDGKPAETPAPKGRTSPCGSCGRPPGEHGAGAIDAQCNLGKPAPKAEAVREAIASSATEPKPNSPEDMGFRDPPANDERIAETLKTRMANAAAVEQLNAIAEDIRAALKEGKVNDEERADLVGWMRRERERVGKALPPGTYPGDEK